MYARRFSDAVTTEIFGRVRAVEVGAEFTAAVKTTTPITTRRGRPVSTRSAL
jgi:hypothetical protein